MCNWQDIEFPYARGRIQIAAQTIQAACETIFRAAQRRQTISYTEVMNELKRLGCPKINRGTIGSIVGEVSIQVSQITKPSIYPSAIVVRSGTYQPGEGFWGVDTGTHPPSRVAHNNRGNALQQYQNDVFNRPWGGKHVERLQVYL